MARIAVDIDSTLYDFETPAREAFLILADKYDDKSLFKGAYLAWSEWRSPTDACGLEIWLEAIALCHDNDAILAQTPFAGAVETCQALIAEGHELIYISSRESETENATYEWLYHNGFWDTGNASMTTLVVVPGHESKDPYMTECQYIIDDRPKTVIQFVYDYEWKAEREMDSNEQMWATREHQERWLKEHERKAFVKAYQYNQALTDVPGIYVAPTWAGLNYYLVGKGVLLEPAVEPALAA